MWRQLNLNLSGSDANSDVDGFAERTGAHLAVKIPGALNSVKRNVYDDNILHSKQLIPFANYSLLTTPFLTAFRLITFPHFNFSSTR